VLQRPESGKAEELTNYSRLIPIPCAAALLKFAPGSSPQVPVNGLRKLLNVFRATTSRLVWDGPIGRRSNEKNAVQGSKFKVQRKNPTWLSPLNPEHRVYADP